MILFSKSTSSIERKDAVSNMSIINNLGIVTLSEVRVVDSITVSLQVLLIPLVLGKGFG